MAPTTDRQLIFLHLIEQSKELFKKGDLIRRLMSDHTGSVLQGTQIKPHAKYAPKLAWYTA